MKLTIVELLGSCCLNPLVFSKLAKILATLVEKGGHPVAICAGQTFDQTLLDRRTAASTT